MLIIVSFYNFINEVKDLMMDIAGRLSIVQPRINYANHIIEINLEIMPNIKIIFVPALREKVLGMRPDYYWTNSYDVDKYFRECGTPKCLQNFAELTNLVLQTCQKDETQWSLIKDLGVKYCDTPGFPSDMKCNCTTEDRLAKMVDFLKERELLDWQWFDTRNFVGDFMETIYCSDGITIDICKGYRYIEIFGMTEEETECFAELSEWDC